MTLSRQRRTEKIRSVCSPRWSLLLIGCASRSDWCLRLKCGQSVGWTSDIARNRNSEVGPFKRWSHGHENFSVAEQLFRFLHRHSMGVNRRFPFQCFAKRSFDPLSSRCSISTSTLGALVVIHRFRLRMFTGVCLRLLSASLRGSFWAELRSSSSSVFHFRNMYVTRNIGPRDELLKWRIVKRSKLLLFEDCSICVTKSLPDARRTGFQRGLLTHPIGI